MGKRMAIMVTILVVIFGGIFGYGFVRGYFIKQYFSHFTPPPITISARPAKTKTWHPYLSAIGNFVATHGVDIASQAAGIVTKINFRSGQQVSKGTLLIKLDDRIEQAELKNNQAQLKLSQLNFQRQEKLFKKGAASSSSLDASRARLQEMQAALEKTEALIARKNITAPFSGKLGIRRVNLGDYITPGVTMLVTLQALDPLYVQFYLPEHDLTKITVGQAVQLKVTAFPKKLFHGKITAINAKVSADTHTILVQATLPNKQRKLYPGMFAEVKVILPKRSHVITIPRTAIAYSLYGDSVFIVKKTGKDKKGKPILKAYRRYIHVGEQRGKQVAVKKGIVANEMVVDAGQLKLHNGARVLINNTVKLD